MSQPVTYNEVVRAATRRLRRGDNPSIDGVRQELGDRGSKTTISKHLNAWRETLPDGLDVLPASLPQELMEPVEQIWHLAVEAAESRYSEHKERADQRVAQAQNDAESERDKAAHWQDYARNLESKLESANFSISQYEASLSDVRETIRARENDIERLNLRIEALEQARSDERAQAQADKDAALAELHNRHDAERAMWQAERDRLSGEVEQAQNETARAREWAEKERERTERQEAYWMQQLDEMRERRNEQQRHYEDQVKRLESDQRVVEAKNQSLSSRLDELSSSYSQLEESYSAVESALANQQAHTTQIRESIQYVCHQLLGQGAEQTVTAAEIVDALERAIGVSDSQT